MVLGAQHQWYWEPNIHSAGSPASIVLGAQHQWCWEPSIHGLGAQHPWCWEPSIHGAGNSIHGTGSPASMVLGAQHPWYWEPSIHGAGSPTSMVLEAPASVLLRTQHQWYWEPSTRCTGSPVHENEDGADNLPVVAYESTVDNSVIIYLVSQGANVNVADIYGSTPLHFAAMRGNEVATKELMECRGIDIEAEDKQQMRALHLAASHNEAEIMSMLIEVGADLRCFDEENGTPLHYACMEGNVKIVKMLFDAAESQGWVVVQSMVTDVDNEKNAALHMAVENRSYDVTQILIDKGAVVNVTTTNYSTPLHLAAVAGDVDILRLLIDNNARLDALDINQMTPLHRAAAHNQSAAVKFLLKRGANINIHDKDNFSPLLLAACNGHAETIETLLSNGANVNDVDKNDKTALYWAAEEDHLEALKVLLKKKSVQRLINIPDRYENTPLHIAAQNGFVPCIQELLEAGADLDAKNEEEQTPLHLAAKNGKTKVVRELVKKDYMVINDEDEDSNTALHLAALNGYSKTAFALIVARANVEARNCTLWTPLDCAAAKGFAKTVQVLLEADAPIDPLDRTRTTPLHLACSRGHVSVVTLLIEWGANVSQRDTDSLNCLDLAINHGHKDVALALINSVKWREVLQNETQGLKGYRDTPMRKLIRKMPDVAEVAFNKCTTSNTNNTDDADYAITFSYEFLDDVYTDWGGKDAGDSLSTASSNVYDDDDRLKASATPYSTNSSVLKKNHPLMIMVKHHQEDLLAHPLVTSLLRYKWDSFGRYFYYINLFLYCIFVTFLTGYVVNTKAPYMYTKYNSTGDFCNDVNNWHMATYNSEVKQDLFAFIGKYVIIGLAALNLIREIFQLFTAKWNYFGWENLMEWITYISALLLVIDFSQCQQDTGIRMGWQWQLAAVAVFLAWMDLVLFIRKLPRFGIYVVMFTDILRTFTQFFPVFFLFIVAFGLAFFVLMQNQYAFRRPEFSLLKTSVMMIGEFEFENIFYNQNDVHKETLYYSAISYTLFVIFLVLMAILVTNLLVGLAVDDIKAVQEQAILKRLAMQVELALDVESIVPQFIRRRFVVKCRTIRPNSTRHHCKVFRRFMAESELSSEAIVKALNPELIFS
ncbi:hypothetical protein LSAT2_022672 [Lamellibrachia satsuma]|nr:hypothetical protein LSAT2_022672 [Lamellibrachia satsuma]